MRQRDRQRLLPLLLLAGCASSGGGDAGLLPNTAGWWRSQVFYEVFVRSFADSDGDGVGDLKGLTARLDRLNAGDGGAGALGVDGLWLMPIFPSPSYHGYDVTDYQAVNPDYGTLADLDALLAAAHARGLRVILDFVPNHSGSGHPWFQDALTPDAGHRDWYVWLPADPGWRRPDNATVWRPLNGSWYYAYFSGGMPDLDWRTPAVEQAVGDAMAFWLARGVDGFRVDAARYLVEDLDAGVLGIADQPETHAIFRRLRRRLAAVNPQVLLVSEVWTEQATVATYYGDGDEFQLSFSFDLADALLSSLRQASSDDLINTLARGEAALAGKDRGFEAPFLSNHDQVRVMRQLGGDAAAARLAAATLLALPGTPFVYYGEELGMQGGAGSDDRQKRTPMRWEPTGPLLGFSSAGSSWFGALAPEAPGVDVATQAADPASLWNRYRRSIALRHQHPALATGDATRVPVGGGGQTAFGLLRAAGSSRVLYVANFGAAALGPLTLAVPGTPAVLDAEGLAGAPSADGGVVALPGLAPRGFAVLSLQ